MEWQRLSYFPPLIVKVDPTRFSIATIRRLPHFHLFDAFLQLKSWKQWQAEQAHQFRHLLGLQTWNQAGLQTHA